MNDTQTDRPGTVLVALQLALLAMLAWQGVRGLLQGLRTDLTVDQLTGMRADGDRGDGHSALGVTVAKLQSALNVRSRLLRDTRTGETCMRPEIRATLTYSPMEVFVASEFAGDACIHDHILEHETRHVRAHEGQLDHASRQLEQAMRAHFANRIFYGRESALRAQLEDDIRTRWLPLAMSYLQEVRSLHERIDTPEEYARNQTACGGRIPRALAGRRPRR